MKPVPSRSIFRCPRLAKAVRIAAAAGAALCTGAAFALLLADRFLPLPPELLTPPPLTTLLRDREGNPLAEFPTSAARRHEPIDIAQMGPFLPAVTVALEDRRFFEHGGVDWRAAARSLRDNLARPGQGGGASTITQQYVKLVRGRGKLPLLDKLLEALHARKLERAWPKRRILAAYLNRVDYGNRLIGAAAAAQVYFGKAPSALTLAEAIFLAGLPQSPNRFNPRLRPEACRAQFRRSCARLARERSPLPDGTATGMVFDPTDLAALEPPELQAWDPRVGAAADTATFFSEEALRRSPRNASEVWTTLDARLQRAVAQLAEAHLDTLNNPTTSAAAVVVLANAGARVRALVSIDRVSPQINCTRIPRSPGSTLKPFVYLTAIDRRRITAATVLPDTREAVRAVYPDYDPKNYSDRFLGPVRAREALANSLNVPAVVVLERVGARDLFHQLEGWGLRFGRGFDAVGAGFILGNCEVTLTDLAAAYSAIARGGIALPPRYVESEVWQARRMASAEACAIVADILSDNSARTREFGPRSPLALPVRVAAKTGTSSGFRDAWAAGFTQDHTVAVWVGNSSGKSMGPLPAIRAAAPLWRAIISHLLARGDRPLAPPDNSIEEVEICSLTGLLPSSASPGTVRELFLAGTAPTERSEGAIAVEDGRAIPLLGPEYAAWCESADNTISARLKEAPTARILSPAAGDVLLIDREMPIRQQRIELRASGPGAAAARWLVDGIEIAAEGGRYFWTLAPGDHVVTLLLEGGESREARFKVLEGR